MLTLRMRSRRRSSMLCILFTGFGFGLATGACAEHVPDQDLRILQAAPMAKLTTDIFWKEYEADARAADRKYHGKAVELSGKVTGLVPDQPPARIMFGPPTPAAGAGTVEARVLDDRASATFAELSVGQRITLRCFVEGLATNLILKSCIKP
jgi:hypothetical protein